MTNVALRTPVPIADVSSPVIEVNALRHRYGTREALRGVDLEVHAAERLTRPITMAERVHLDHRR